MMDGGTSPRFVLASEKIERRHRDRLAMVYIRQSTMQQVERHHESTRLQYALTERAFALGWPREGIVVIDDDLGRSGASIEGRLGFQRLVAEVALGRVGMVLGIEMSRLARSCADWYHLLESCARFDTLIADADGVYDPATYNDRLLLGLKGTMSEAELHIIKARMLAGRRAKARRGELGKTVPMGYVVRPSGEVTFDPDEQARATIHLVFDLFERFRTVGKVLRYLVDHEVRMPVRARTGVAKGELEWHRPNRVSLHNLLRNPTYAGAYVWGTRAVDRRRQKPGRPGTGRQQLRPEEAEVLIHDRVPAYIDWEHYERNQAQLAANVTGRRGPVRAGEALLSGLLICGRCGLRMTAQYNNNGHRHRYTCGRMATDYAEPMCQSLIGAPLDALVGDLVVAALAPAALEASLQVAADLEAERQGLERHWRQRLERASFEAERAHRQYAAVEPENRLVARSLERAWEEALSEQARLKTDFERFRREQPSPLTAAEAAAIRDLAADLPALWRAPSTTREDRQTIVRLLLERILVTVEGNSERVQIECHWAGGHRTAHHLVRPVARLDQLSSYGALVARATALHGDGLTYPAIAETLNAEGWYPAKRRATFNGPMVHHLLLKAGVVERQYRRAPTPLDRDPDEWSIRELANHLGMPEPTLYTWVQQGRLRCRTVAGTGGPGRKLIHADAADIARLKAIRATPPPWRRLPPPLDPTSSPQR